MPERYDLIFSFEAVHHATDVPAFMRAIHAALNPGGIFVCFEEPCADTLEANIGPGGAILYASNVLACVPQVLSESAEAFGTTGLTVPKMRELSEQAGFSAIRLVPSEQANYNIYEIKR